MELLEKIEKYLLGLEDVTELTNLPDHVEAITGFRPLEGGAPEITDEMHDKIQREIVRDGFRYLGASAGVYGATFPGTNGVVGCRSIARSMIPSQRRIQSPLLYLSCTNVPESFTPPILEGLYRAYHIIRTRPNGSIFATHDGELNSWFYDEEGLKPIAADFEAANWDVRSHVVTIAGVDHEVPTFAIPPAGSPLRSSTVVLFSCMGSSLDMVKNIEDAYWETHTEAPEHEEAEKAMEILREMLADANGITSRVHHLTNQVRRHDSSIASYIEHVASSTRSKNEALEELKGLKSSIMPSIIESYKLRMNIVDDLQKIRNIASVTKNGDWINLETYPFAMKLDMCHICDNNTNDCTAPGEHESQVIIGPLLISIKPTGTDFDSSIRVQHGDDMSVFHPHVSSEGRICWGNAGTELAAAWGNKHWESVVRIILGWMVIYNGDDPFNDEWTLRDYLETTSSRGWLTPASEAQTATA